MGGSPPVHIQPRRPSAPCHPPCTGHVLPHQGQRRPRPDAQGLPAGQGAGRRAFQGHARPGRVVAADRCAGSASDRVPCRAAFKSAEALDLSARRWTKMLVSRQAHDFGIVVEVAVASTGGAGGCPQSASQRYQREARRSAGCPSVDSGRGQFRSALARAGNARLGAGLEDAVSRLRRLDRECSGARRARDQHIHSLYGRR